jgi:hypothetical protein
MKLVAPIRMKKIVRPTPLPSVTKVCCQYWRMTPGKPKMNAPGQKMAQALAINTHPRRDGACFSIPESLNS